MNVDIQEIFLIVSADCGPTGEDLAQQPDGAAGLSRACAALKDNIPNPDSVSQLTGRLSAGLTQRPPPVRRRLVYVVRRLESPGRVR